jgi:hypothetical protein
MINDDSQFTAYRCRVCRFGEPTSDWYNRERVWCMNTNVKGLHDPMFGCIYGEPGGPLPYPTEPVQVREGLSSTHTAHTAQGDGDGG